MLQRQRHRASTYRRTYGVISAYMYAAIYAATHVIQGTKVRFPMTTYQLRAFVLATISQRLGRALFVPD